MNNIHRYIKWAIYTLIFSLVAIIHSAFISALPPFFSAINLSLIALFFILLFADLDTALIISILLGFWLDILSFSWFGLNAISLFVALYITNIILTNWLTNRSLYSFLALSSIGTIIYNLLLHILIFLWQGSQESSRFFFFTSSFWTSLYWQMAWSVIFMILFFNFASSLSKRLKPFFLEKK